MKQLGQATWHVQAGCLRLHQTQCTSTLAAVPGDVGPLSSLHVSDWCGWWWPHLAVKTTAADGIC